MGQSKSIFLESDDENLENDQIDQQQQIQRHQPVPKLPAIQQMKIAQKPPIMSSPTITTSELNTEGKPIKQIKLSDDTKPVPTNTNLQLPDDDTTDENKIESDTQQQADKQANISPDTEDEKKPEIEAIDISKYAVNYKHVHIAITEFADSIKVTDKHSATKLLDIFEKISMESADFKAWQVGSKPNAKNRMKSVIDYAEKNAKCSPDVKVKLRIMTKMMMESKSQNEYKNILLLLASHGNVCHVMKEVAINNAYGMMTNNLSEYIKSQSLQQQILKVLRDYRVLLVEKLFHSFKFSNNTHYIAGFHNHIAKEIGVIPYNDPDICYPYGKNWRKGLDKRYFKTLYTMDNILECIMTQIEEKKIGYQKVVKFFEDHCPENMAKNEFLQEVIDIDTGDINQGYMVWLLEKLEIFEIKGDDWKEIEKCWDDI